MKPHLLVLIIVILTITGCATTRDQKMLSYEIKSVAIINEMDTTSINEFRMIHPKSALNTFDMMSKNYGKPAATYKGKYQENINQSVWNNVPLLNNEERFTIITDGTETRTNYFTSMMIFDSKNKDCLTSLHKDRQALLEVITLKMSPYIGSSK